MGAWKSRCFGIATCLLIVTVLTPPVIAGEQRFTLARAIPNDVFLYVANRTNPEQSFINDYWGEVIVRLENSGLGTDLLELVGSLLDEHSRAELDRLKQRTLQLLAGVNWVQLCQDESAFAERLPQPVSSGGDLYIGPPNMVWLFHGDANGVKKNFDGLVAILQAISEEINQAAQIEILSVEAGSRKGAQLSSLDLFARIPGAPPLSLHVAHRGELLFIALGEPLLDDVLALLNGDGEKQALANDPRFQSALARLPAPEDSITFFDMQSMLRTFQKFSELIVAAMNAPGDVYLNTRMEGPEEKPHSAALAAYRRGDEAEALRQTQEAHQLAPGNTIILYNLACFHALSGHKAEALDWLEKAVAGGFYAAEKIAGDTDLDSLRSDARYQAVLSQAARLALESSAEDIMINSSMAGESWKLSQQAVLMSRQPQPDYSQCLRLTEQAHELAPTDSGVLYNLACYNALLGRQDKALNYLDRAVDGGFYRPDQMAEDSDLENIRSTDRFQAARARARAKAMEMAANESTRTAALVRSLADQLLNAIGILDYSASVVLTEGYSVHSHTVDVLVPDAPMRPIYAVFAERPPLAEFERYLPRETLSFSVSNGIDLSALYGMVETAIGETGAKGQELLAAWSEIQSGLQLDLKRDVLAWIQGETVAVTLEDNKGWVFLVRITDEPTAREKVAAATEFLSTRLNEMVSKIPPVAMFSVHRAPLQHDRLEGFEKLTFAMAPTEPMVWGVADGRLILGSSADAIMMCLETAQGRHANIRENPRVVAEALLPEGPLNSLTLEDYRNWPDEIASFLGIISMAGGMAQMFVPDPKAREVISKIAAMVGKLTPIVRTMDFYKSKASCTTRDGSVWRSHEVTHYFSPAERAGRKPAPDPAKDLNGL